MAAPELARTHFQRRLRLADVQTTFPHVRPRAGDIRFEDGP